MKMDISLYKSLKDELKTGYTQNEIAAAYGISQPTVSTVKRARSLKEYFRLANPRTR